MWRVASSVIAVAVTQVVLITPTFAEEKKAPVKPSHTWKGSVADDQLGQTGPKLISTKKDFEAIWKEWKIEGDVPTVDFDKEVIAVVYSRGSVLNIVATVAGGNLEVSSFGTKDLRPGTRYVMGAFSREGVTKVNGVVLK